MFIKTQDYNKKYFKTNIGSMGSVILKTTVYWLLFIPLYIKKEVVEQNGYK